MSHNPSLVITRTIQSFGKWSYHKLAAKYEKICKNIEDVVSKGNNFDSYIYIIYTFKL